MDKSFLSNGSQGKSTLWNEETMTRNKRMTMSKWDKKSFNTTTTTVNKATFQERTGNEEDKKHNYFSFFKKKFKKICATDM